MSLLRLPEIPRAFAEWGTEQVVQWLTTLQLSRNYAKQFRDHNIDGAALLRLNPSSLSSLGITDSLDRVKLLQQITTMQADLASLASPARRWRGSGKFRRFSENSPAYRTVAIPSRRMSTDEAKPVHTLAASRSRSRPSVLDAYLEQWSRSRAQFPRKLSSSSGTVYSDAGTSQSVIGMSQSDVGASHSESTLAHAVTRTAHSDVGPPRSRSAQGREEGVGAPLRRKTSHLKEKKKRLSRSVDKLWEAHLASNPLPLMTNHQTKTGHGMSHYHSASAQFQESIPVQLHDGVSRRATGSVQLHDSGAVRLHESARLVGILREENTTLKRELETYYQRVRKLMRLEQELEKVREAHRLLEESSGRRERLEAAMRSRLEAELAQLRRNNARHRRHSEISERQNTETSALKDASSEKGLKGREAAVRRQQKNADQSTVHDTQNRTETDVPQVYSHSIDQLRKHLQSLQLISQRREELEERVRMQLQTEIQELRGRGVAREGGGCKEEDLGREEGKTGEGEDKGEGREGKRQGSGGENWETGVALLQTDLTKCEQKLAAEKELAVEGVLVHKEAHISHLKQALEAREGDVAQLTLRCKACQHQLDEAHIHIAELEASLSILQFSMATDTAIQSLQSTSHKSPRHHVHSSPTHQAQPSPTHYVHTSPSQAYSSPSHPSHSSPSHPSHSSPGHHVHSSPSHPSHSSPSHPTHSSSGHHIHSSPSPTTHSSPSHPPYSSPNHQAHPSPSRLVYSSPIHQAHHTPTPTHQVHPSPSQASATHRVHHSPTHQVHSSPTRTLQPSPTHKKRLATSGSTQDLSLGSSTSPSSSLINEPQSHSDTQRRQDQHHTPYLTNGGGDPAINTSLPPRGQNSEPQTSTLKRQQANGEAPVINSSLTTNGGESTLPLPKHSAISSPVHGSSRQSASALISRSGDRTQSKSSLPTTYSNAPHPTNNQSDCRNSTSAPSSNSPRHLVRRVIKSKTPPPRNEVHILPKKYKNGSMERGPSSSHASSDLQLFNTLLGDRTRVSGRGVKLNGNHGGKGVNILFSPHHGNRV